MDDTFIPRGGALRLWSEATQEYVYANPHDPLYSTVSMSATEYWDGEQWVAIHIDDVP